MAGGSPGRLQRDLTTLFQVGTAAGLTDRELIARIGRSSFEDAEASFEALVTRHGPMVLRVCRNVLNDPHDAEDAFQATFLVLVKQLRTIRSHDSIGSWLYGVAARVSARARVEAAKRRKYEQGTMRLAVVAAPDDEAFQRPGGPGGSPPASRTLPIGRRPLLLGRPDPRASRLAARLPARHRPQSNRPGARPAPKTARPPRRRADRRCRFDAGDPSPVLGSRSQHCPGGGESRLGPGRFQGRRGAGRGPFTLCHKEDGHDEDWNGRGTPLPGPGGVDRAGT